jgi:hypothetical protein
MLRTNNTTIASGNPRKAKASNNPIIIAYMTFVGISEHAEVIAWHQTSITALAAEVIVLAAVKPAPADATTLLYSMISALRASTLTSNFCPVFRSMTSNS